MSHPLPTREILVVHYLPKDGKATLCGKATKPSGGPSWVIPGHAQSKSVVDCETCIALHAEAQKAPK